MLILRPEQIQLLRAGLPVIPANGGDSGSSSSSSSTQSSTTSTTTTNIDKRQVVDTGSVGVSSDSSTVNVTLLDDGAVKAAIALVEGADVRQSADYGKFLDLTRAAFAEVLKVVDKNTRLAQELTGSVGDAYEVAQSSVSGARDQQKTLLIIGAVVMGLALFRSR